MNLLVPLNRCLVLSLCVLIGSRGLAAPTKQWNFGNPDSAQQQWVELNNEFRANGASAVERLWNDPEVLATFNEITLTEAKAVILNNIKGLDFHAVVPRDTGYGWRQPLSYRGDWDAQFNASVANVNTTGYFGSDYPRFAGSGTMTVEGFPYKSVLTYFVHRLAIIGSGWELQTNTTYTCFYHHASDNGKFNIYGDIMCPRVGLGEEALVDHRQLVGVVYTDLNENGRYDPGEGLAGVTVMPSQGDYYAVTASGGGYVIDFPKNAGNFTVTASGGSLTAPLTLNASIADLNVKVDFVLKPPARPIQVSVPTGDGSTQIVNLSTRGIVGTGENALIAGFVISGSGSKNLLVIASGLNLRRFGLTGEIGRPHFTLYQNVSGTNSIVTENSNWQDNQTAVAAAISQVGAQQLTPSTDPTHGDAGAVVALKSGVYSVVIDPAVKSATQDGIGLIEIYDIATAGDARLVNLSSRGKIESGARQMIVGVVVTGTGHERLMIRGAGPALKALGVSKFLANPALTLFQNVSGNQLIVGSNDDWWNSPQADQAALINPAIGAFSFGAYSNDASIVIRLAPGVYSSIISPSDGSPGVALAEIYEVL
jgi:hypothetical protein